MFENNEILSDKVPQKFLQRNDPGLAHCSSGIKLLVALHQLYIAAGGLVHSSHNHTFTFIFLVAPWDLSTS